MDRAGPDPAERPGVPTRLVFGLEEVWKNERRPARSTGRTQFEVVGPYFAGDDLPVPQHRAAGVPDARPRSGGTHHDAPGPARVDLDPEPRRRRSTLAVGNDGGAYVQKAARGAALSADNWGRGANDGFNTLLPYDAQVAKDGTIYAGLQDNGELKIQPDGKQFEVYGGDGAFSAVDPDDSTIAYESYTFNAISKTDRRRRDLELRGAARATPTSSSTRSRWIRRTRAT